MSETDNKDMYSIDEEQAPDRSSPPSPLPPITSLQSNDNLRLSTVSRQYDRNNKGYLDHTEQQLRALDDDNLGYLKLDKVFKIVEEMKEEQRKALTMSKVVYGLCALAVLLALANVGSSFAAAKLAQEMHVDGTGNLLSSSGESIGVTDRETVFLAEPLTDNEEDRRLMEEILGGDRRLAYNIGSGSGNFKLKRGKALQLMQKLCGNIPNNLNSYASNGFTCGSTGKTSVEHCAGFMTKLAYTEKPEVSGGNFVFHFKGKQMDFNTGTGKLECDLSNNKPCVFTEGITCDPVCRVCSGSNGDQWEYWQCAENEQCGCFPGGGGCLTPSDPKPFCTEQCAGGNVF